MTLAIRRWPLIRSLLRPERTTRLALYMAAGLVALAPAAPVRGQWTTESALPTHLQVRGIAAPAPGRVFLATDNDSGDAGGALFESQDGGGSWIQRAVPASLEDGLSGVFFLDSQRGWVWGNANYRTTDGGTTWQAMPVLGSAAFMEFSTADFGLATGNFGAYVSRDGGASWAPSPQGMTGFSFTSASTGLGRSENGIFRTTDGGANFTAVQAGAADSVAFLSPTVAIAIVDGTFLRSTDAGLNWTAVGTAVGRSRLFAISANVALAWGRTGSAGSFDDRLLRTTDGGLTWSDLGEPIDPGESSSGLGFSKLSSTTVVAADGAGNLYRSTDAGLTWARVFSTPGPFPGFSGNGTPVFTGALTGYAGFGPGFVIRTADGGATWSQISSGSGSEIIAMDRFDNGDLIAVGEAGQVLTRTAASAQWLVRATLSPFALEAVQVLGPQDVVTVDREGRVYRSADAGETWTASASTPGGVVVADLYFETPLAGWVVGQGFDGGALFHTVDGGSTWNAAGDFAGTYVAVDFVGASGWAAAVYGSFYRTTNHGGSWSEIQLPGAPQALLDMDFWNASVGYAVGDFGYAARTNDGGLTWQLLPTPSDSDRLSDIVLVGPDELWLSSADGVVLYSATGGQNWAVMNAGPASFGGYSTITATPAGDAWIAGYRGIIRHFSGPPPAPVNQPPAAAFNFVTTGLSVAFSDGSSDPDGSIASWAWSFGDGGASSASDPSHLYATAGTYLVRLTVTDDDGSTDLAGEAIVVQPGPGGTFGEFSEVTPLDPLFVTPQNEDFWVTSAAPADYDGDGDLDIAVLGYYVVYNESVVDHLVLMRNDGPVSGTEWELSYTEVPLGTLTAGASDLAWGDADGDGDPDLVVGSDGQTVLYLNDSGTLLASDTVLPGYWEDNGQADFDLHSISWADFDNDGDLDLLLPSVWDEESSTSRTALLRNDGSNGSGGRTFTEVAAGFAATDHAQSTWADFDGDQDLDLLLVNLAPLTGEGFIRRYRNDGGGVFVGEDILGALTVDHGEAQWGDYDGDGDLDILVAGNLHEIDDTYDTALRIYRNDSESYVALDVLDCPGCEGWFDLTAATWADYDSDGDIDILLAGNYNPGSQIEGRAKVYDNQGGIFVDSGNQLPAPRASGSQGGSFSWLDLDADGDLDYFIAGQYFVPGGNGLVEAQMHLYVNDAAAENRAPSAPSGLAAQVESDGSVQLGWLSASDDLTPAPALTYELRLFRGGVPLAGERHLPEPGNLSAATSWNLAVLADGEYDWTVQAVDSAFNSGPAATGSFLIGAPPVPIFENGFESGNVSAWSQVRP
ncbi:MAG: YCF48-related protein [Thermoanaerobaculia bacterium]